MKLLYKHILVLFSVALNVGFVIVALTTLYQHSTSSHDRSWRELVEIVHRLDLPPAQSQAALDNMRQFRSTLDHLDQELDRARDDIILLLAQDGPVDRDRLHQLIEVADAYEKRKGARFEAHVMELRDLLGAKKGPQFFSLLLQHLKTTDEKSHR